MFSHVNETFKSANKNIYLKKLPEVNFIRHRILILMKPHQIQQVIDNPKS